MPCAARAEWSDVDLQQRRQCLCSPGSSRRGAHQKTAAVDHNCATPPRASQPDRYHVAHHEPMCSAAATRFTHASSSPKIFSIGAFDQRQTRGMHAGGRTSFACDTRRRVPRTVHERDAVLQPQSELAKHCPAAESHRACSSLKLRQSASEHQHFSANADASARASCASAVRSLCLLKAVAH